MHCCVRYIRGKNATKTKLAPPTNSGELSLKQMTECQRNCVTFYVPSQKQAPSFYSLKFKLITRLHLLIYIIYYKLRKIDHPRNGSYQILMKIGSRTN